MGWCPQNKRQKTNKFNKTIYDLEDLNYINNHNIYVPITNIKIESRTFF